MPEDLREELSELRELVRELRSDIARYRVEQQGLEHFVSYKALFTLIAAVLALFGLVSGWIDSRRAREDEALERNFKAALQERPPWLSEWTREVQEVQRHRPPLAPPEKPEPTIRQGPTPEQLREVERLRRKTRR